jgi:hypothetical protein
MHAPMNTTADDTSWQARHLYWVCQATGWGGYTVTRILAAIVYLHLGWLQAIAEVVLLNGLALMLTHLLRPVMKRGRWGSLGKLALMARIAAVSAVLGILLGVATQFTSLVAFQDPSRLGIDASIRFGPVILFWLNTLNWIAIFAIWQALYRVAITLRQHKSAELRQSELVRALQLAELRLLKSQLNPHFMFNALNAVRSLIAEDARRAQDAVTRLANTLRYTLTAGQEEVVTLRRELEIVEDYLEIESLRFEDRLTVRCNVTSAARDVRIPVMMLQTLVENAIKHGIAELPEGGELKIDGEIENGALILQVENPRPAKKSASDSSGIGLRNAADRLRLLFGADAHLDVDLSNPTLATTRIRIPQPG